MPESQPTNTDPFDAMRSIETTLRQDLQITRTSSQGEPTYLIYDPVSFRSHRLSLNDYRVVSAIHSNATLNEAFSACVRDGQLQPSEEAEFFRFVQQLMQLGVLTSSSHDPGKLYERYSKTQQASKKMMFGKLLFMTLPLSNPDKFLDRTIDRFRFLFSPIVAAIWLTGAILATLLVLAKWQEYWQPLNSLLAVKNIVFMAASFTLLKVWHELGHGYACKLFGGRVPEMGCKLMLGMPLAYVDASAAWSFPRRRDRILVMLAGMYFETLIAIPALWIWAWTPHSQIGSFAYQVSLMAGITTFIFNVNPLMKYDGYFVLSEVLGIPNLRERSQKEIYRCLKSRVLGIKGTSTTAKSWRDQLILIVYGTAAMIYGQMLMLSIAAMIAIQLQVVGLAIAAFQIGSTLYKNARKLYTYLWHSEETKPVRGRAVAVGWSLAIGLPITVAVCPMPGGSYVPGVVTSAKKTQIHAATPGRVVFVLDPPPSMVKSGQTLVKLENLDSQAEKDSAWISFIAAKKKVVAGKLAANGLTDRAEAAQSIEAAMHQAIAHSFAEKNYKRLCITAPHQGRLINLLPRQAIGSYLQVGQPIAEIVTGHAQVRAWVDEDQVAFANLAEGEQVAVRLSSDRIRTYMGTIRTVAPAANSEFKDMMLTSMGEGTISVDANTGKTLEPMFEVTIAIPELDCAAVSQGVTASIRLDRTFETIGGWIYRKTRKFIMCLMAQAN